MPQSATFPAYTYTLGLSASHHPDAMVIGLSPLATHTILSRLYAGIQAGQRYDQTGCDYDLHEAIRVQSCPVGDDWQQRLIGYTPAFLTYGFVQLVWGDVERRMPWEEGYQTRLIAYQPVLAPPGAF
jgi:hypothetical protein